MDRLTVLRVFASHFVLTDFRDRFVHEALKKPGKLHERICHRIEGVFPEQYRGRTIAFEPDGPCLVIGWSATMQALTWSAAAEQVGLGGFLVIGAAGEKFYAETEGEPRIHTWAGQR